jgi:hypothetical protein
MLGQALRPSLISAVEELMSIPDTFVQVVIFVLFVVPGVTFSTLRTAIIGYRSPDFSVPSRILEGLFVSVLFDALYVLLFYAPVISIATAKSPSAAFAKLSLGQALIAAFLLLIVPAFASAWASGARIKWVNVIDDKRRLRVTLKSNYRPIPTAWDYKGLGMPSQFVRIRTENGVYFGGWYGGSSLMSTYPQPRDIYIQSQWQLNPNGEFVAKIEGGAGLWLAITDGCVVDWLGANSSAVQ